MSVWGKIVGGVLGYALASAPGAVAGGLIGHFLIDQSHDKQVNFTIALIALTAKMCKADGQVSPLEIEAVHHMLRVPEKERRNMTRVFNMAQGDIAGFEAYAQQIAHLYKDEPRILEDVLDVLFFIAFVDGHIHPHEEWFIAVVAEIFKIDEVTCERIRARHDPSMMANPYQVLGVDERADISELRRAYRDAVRDNHPDQLQARGMPPEMMHIATARMAVINEAWRRIKQEQGIA